MVGIGSSSSCRLGISQYVVPVQQPPEDIVLSNTALHLLETAAFLQLCVNLPRVHAALRRLLSDPVIEILLGGGEPLLLRYGFDHQVATDLPLRHRAKLSGELITLRLGNLIRFSVILDELLHPALRNVERVGGNYLVDELLPDRGFGFAPCLPLHVSANDCLQSLE